MAEIGMCKADVDSLLAAQGIGLGSTQEVSNADPSIDSGCITSWGQDTNNDDVIDVIDCVFNDCVGPEFLTSGTGHLEFYFDSASVPLWTVDLFHGETPPVPDAGMRLSLRLGFESLIEQAEHSQALEAVLLFFADEDLVAFKLVSLTDERVLADGTPVGTYMESSLFSRLSDPGAPPVGTTKTQLFGLDTGAEIGRLYVSRNDGDPNVGSNFWVSGPDGDNWDSQVAEPVAGGPLVPSPSYYSPVYTKPDYFGSISTDYGPDNAIGDYVSYPSDLYGSSYYNDY